MSLPEPYWQDGDRDLRIYHGDCREVMAEFGADEFGSVITDPPYGIDKKEYLDVPPDEGIRDECLRISEGTVLMWCGATPRSLTHFVNLGPDRVLVWTPSFTLSCVRSNGMFWKWQALCLWRLPKDQKVFRTDVITTNTFGGKKAFNHIAARPQNIMEMLCAAFGGCSVLDPYLGSGTTLAACAKLGLPGVGIEISEEYCEMAAARLSDDVTYGEEANLFTAREELQP